MRLWRIRDRRTFALLRSRGARRRSGPVSVTAVAADDGTPPRVAFAVGRRVGPAVVRNRVRRRLRAALQEVGPPAGAYLVGAGRSAADLPFRELTSHLRAAVTAAHEAAKG